MKKLIKNIVQNKKFPKNFLTYERVHVGIYLVLLLLICVFSIHRLFGENPNPMVTKVFNIIVLSLIIVLLFFAYKMSIFIFKGSSKLTRPRMGGVYINPKHPIGKIIFLILFIIPIVMIILVLLNVPVQINYP
ncbi:hypothetical protein LLWA12L8_FAMOGCFE_02203 [Lactococcus lactis]|uniref:XRE family transcriptional regulator n=1 Tax=Lactococcus lactis TaxID=1358 RepID=UPI00384E4ACF